MKKEEKQDKSSAEARLDFVTYVGGHLHDQIKLADRKASWIFSLIAIGTGALATKVSNIDWLAVDKTKVMVMLVITAVLITGALVQTASVIYPRISKGSKKGMAYFEDIIQNKKREYLKKGENISEDHILRDLYDESYDLAGIASKKFRALHYGIILTVVSLISTIIMLLLI